MQIEATRMSQTAKQRLKIAREAMFKSKKAAAAAMPGIAYTTYQPFEEDTNDRSPSEAQYKIIARTLNVSLDWLIRGVDEMRPRLRNSEPRIASVPIRGELAAGLWLEQFDYIDDHPEMVPHVETARYKHLDQFAFRVRGPSMDLARIFDGDYVVCVPFAEARGRPQHGDTVVIERRSGGFTERSCKQVEIVGDSVKLCPKSSDPRFQEPIPYKMVDDPDSPDYVHIVGLVIYRGGAVAA